MGLASSSIPHEVPTTEKGTHLVRRRGGKQHSGVGRRHRDPLPGALHLGLRQGHGAVVGALQSAEKQADAQPDSAGHDPQVVLPTPGRGAADQPRFDGSAQQRP